MFQVDSKKYQRNPKSLLINSVSQTKEKGQSTLLIITKDKDDMLWSAKMGDSGFVVYKKRHDPEENRYHYTPILLSQPHEK